MNKQRHYYVYILATKIGGTLYIGVTNDIARRYQEHRDGLVDGFTKRYNVKCLVYVEAYPTVLDAIAREKRLKKYPRQWKINLIMANNPRWDDVSEGLWI